MGMDYAYAGSASYQRFDDEMTEIAKLFGGVLREDIQKKRDNAHDNNAWLVWGYAGLADGDDKYIFPKGTNKLLVKWFNKPYDEYTYEETKKIWDCLRKYDSEIHDISIQIYTEFYERENFKEGWYIS